MTKVRRWLAGAGAAAVLSIAMLGIAGAFGTQRAAAESPPAPPARFGGTVTVDGRPATPGTVITAYVGSTVCKVTQVQQIGADSRYTIDVPALDPGAAPNCGTDGAVVTFYIGDKKAAETGRWRNYDYNALNLTYVTPPPVVPVVTPAPPRTGDVSGADSGSTGLLFVLVGLGALALGAGGVTAARRSR